MAEHVAGTRAQAPGRWLFGPVSDLLLGCGLGYVLIFVILSQLGPRATELVPLGLLPLVLLVTGTPHYGATLLRVYEQRESRRKYAYFAVGASAVLALLFIAAIYYHPLGSLLLTIYFDWNPWHYAGQNYGLALMLLHRRGVTVSPVAKRLLWLSFVLSFLLAFVEMNGMNRAALYAPDFTQTAAKAIGPVYQFIPIGIPRNVQSWLSTSGILLYALATLAAGVFLLRSGRLRDLGPSALLVATQSLWFVVPAASRLWGFLPDVLPLSQRHFQYAFMWVAVGHAVQYLWVTTYYAQKEPHFGGRPRYLLKCVLAGAVIWNLPALVFAPSFFGTAAYSDGLRLLVASVVNLHHFVLDGAIWKLRDGSVARILLRPSRSDGPEPIAPVAGGWLRPALWTAGAFCVAIATVGTLEREFGVRQASERGDLRRVAEAAQRLAWIGQDDAAIHRYLGGAEVKRGRDDAALAAYARSLELRDHPKAWFEIGRLRAERGEWDQAAAALEAAYAIDPFPVPLVQRLAQAQARAGRPARAAEVLREGLALHPDEPALKKLLQQTERILERRRGGPREAGVGES